MSSYDDIAPFGAHFAHWVFDKDPPMPPSKGMFKAWLTNALIIEAEEGWAPTTKGRDAAMQIAERAQQQIKDQVARERSRKRGPVKAEGEAP